MAVVAAVVAVPAPARAATPSIDILDAANLELSDSTGPNFAGISVASAGDVNGDGISDVVLGAPGFDAAGDAYVVFGGRQPQTLDLDDLKPDDGYRLEGIGAVTSAGTGVANAGDVNGDGVPDQLIGASSAGAEEEGAVYVMYGVPDPSTLDPCTSGEEPRCVVLQDLVANGIGYSIEGDVSLHGSLLGITVANAGDVNGDGVPDHLLGAPAAEVGGNLFAGVAYVVFGQRSPQVINLGSMAPDVGYRIDGHVPDGAAGLALANADDVNGDGVPDQLVGVPEEPAGAVAGGGVTYLLYGLGDPSGLPVCPGHAVLRCLALVQVTSELGYRMWGPHLSESGSAVADAGDVNGDGVPDHLVGASSSEFLLPGISYVVFGRRQGANVIVLDHLTPSEGYAIEGAAHGDESGTSLADAGDVNGDGVPDQLVGAPASDAGGEGAGAAYVVFGQRTASPARIRLADLGGQGYRLEGPAPGATLGRAVAAAGDMNGDGMPDQLVGAPATALNGDGAGMVFAALSSSVMPRVWTGPALLESTSGALLTGSVDTHSQPATARYQWGTTTAYGSETALEALGPSQGPVPVLAELTGLAASTEYHYRMSATNGLGLTTYGADRTFVTSAPSAPGVVPPGPAGASRGRCGAGSIQLGRGGATLALTARFVRRLRGAGLRLRAVAPARRESRTIRLPVTGGGLRAGARGGRICMKGGITLSAGRRHVTLSAITLDLSGRPHIDARVRSRRLRLAILHGRRPEVRLGEDRASLSGSLRLTASAARWFRHALGTRALRAGMPIARLGGGAPRR